MPYTLLIIDMQPDCFNSATGKRVRKNCLREIKQAVKDQAHILFLEYYASGDTDPELLAAAPEGSRSILIKHQDDGSREVEDHVRVFKRPTNFRICGINTDYCVLSTVRGLTSRFPMSKIQVVADACDSDWNHLGGLDELTQMIGKENVVRP